MSATHSTRRTILRRMESEPEPDSEADFSEHPEMATGLHDRRGAGEMMVSLLEAVCALSVISACRPTFFPILSGFPHSLLLIEPVCVQPQHISSGTSKADGQDAPFTESERAEAPRS